MNFLKKIYLIVILMLTFIRCTEIYKPNIESGTKALIVEGLITDAEGPYTIKLSLAKPLPYDSVNIVRFIVHDAKLTITDSEKNTYTLKESTGGNYTTPENFKAKVGNTYKLLIITKDGNRYESKPEKLLPPQTYDSIYSSYVLEDYLNLKNVLLNVSGADVRVNLFNSLPTTDSVPLCRFAPKITIQYFYTYREKDLAGNDIMIWRWDNFGWKTYKLNSLENITEDKSASSNPFIKNHLIGFIPNDPASYGLDLPEPTIIYYLRTDQYTLNNDSYRFYKDANNQLTANGKIFDPITSQLYGNMRCINDPSKIVLGLFEVSSIKKHAFVLDLSILKIKIYIRKSIVMDMQKDMVYHYKVWESAREMPANDTLFNFIPLPDWWNHY